MFILFTSLMVCMRTSLAFPTTPRGPFLNTREICTLKCMDMKIFLMRLWTHPCLNFFHRDSENAPQTDGFMLCGKLGVGSKSVR